MLEEEETQPDTDIEETQSKKLKITDLILIAVLVLVVILGCILMKGEVAEPNYQLPLTLTGEVGLQQLTYAEYKEKVDNNEAFVLIIERATCSHCVNFMPVAEEFASTNNLPMYYVDTDTFSAEDWNGFEKSNTFLKKNSSKWGTPTTIVLAGSEAVDYIEGETNEEQLLNLYKKYFDIVNE